MEEYRGLIRERDVWLKVGLLIGCGVLFYVQLMRGQIFYMIAILILAISLFFKKEHIISEKGIDINYYVLGIKSINHWDWDEVTSMKPDYLKARPDVILLIAKDISIRSFKMKPEDARGAMQLAKRMNPKLGTDFYTEEEQEEQERKYNQAKKKRK